MSNFRDNVINQVIIAAEHPQRAYATLTVLEEAFADKYQDSAALESMVNVGLYEALCLIRNLRKDIAREYGYVEEGN